MDRSLAPFSEVAAERLSFVPPSRGAKHDKGKESLPLQARIKYLRSKFVCL